MPHAAKLKRSPPVFCTIPTGFSQRHQIRYPGICRKASPADISSCPESVNRSVGDIDVIQHPRKHHYPLCVQHVDLRLQATHLCTPDVS